MQNIHDRYWNPVDLTFIKADIARYALKTAIEDITNFHDLQ